MLNFRGHLFVGLRNQSEGGQRRYSTATSAGSTGAKSTSYLEKLDGDKYIGLYKTLSEFNTLAKAYWNIKSSPGNMTPGVGSETLDEITNAFLTKLSRSLRDESFQFRPARRIHIPKANGKKRPLAIASPRDKIVQEAMRMVLQSVFESSFSDLSHGFRPGRGCHSALQRISR